MVSTSEGMYGILMSALTAAELAQSFGFDVSLWRIPECDNDSENQLL